MYYGKDEKVTKRRFTSEEQATSYSHTVTCLTKHFIVSLESIALGDNTWFLFHSF
jgi:hypothetical protein